MVGAELLSEGVESLSVRVDLLSKVMKSFPQENYSGIANPTLRQCTAIFWRLTSPGKWEISNL